MAERYLTDQSVWSTTVVGTESLAPELQEATGVDWVAHQPLSAEAIRELKPEA